MDHIIGANSTNTDGSRKQAALAAVCEILGGYEQGYELVAGRQQDAIERFVVLSAKGTPRLLLPPERPAMQTAIVSFLGGRRFARHIPSLVNAALWAGGPFSRVSENLSLTSSQSELSPLRELLCGVLQRNDFQIALRLSFGRPNAKMVAMAISDAGEVLCFAKFGSEQMTNELVAHESAVLEKFEGTQMPVLIPRRLYSGTWAGGRHVLITAALKMQPLKSDASNAHQAADELARLYPMSSSALGDSAYWGNIVESVKTLGQSTVGELPVQVIVADIEKAWSRFELDFGVSHGDWTRANLGLVEGRVAALDWERCTLVTPRGIDIAHFAICEHSFRTFNRTVNIEQVAERTRQYLKAANLPPANTEILIMLALLEMVIRFKSAQSAGLRSADSKFGPALQAGLQKWATRS